LDYICFELEVIMVAETSEFSKRAKKLLSEREKFDLISYLAEQRELAKLTDLLIQEGSKTKRGKKS